MNFKASRHTGCLFLRVILLIYFDNAATSGKKPQTVVNAVGFALNYLSANPGRSGHNLSSKTADAVYNVRKKLSDFFGSQGPETVVFTQNCTHSINCVLKGVLRQGDHIVISELEHNAVMRPLKKMKIKYSVAKIGDTISQTLENFKKEIKPNTRLVLTTGASNVTGEILPFYEIGKICKQRGVRFCVDGAQVAGVLPINMQEMNIDYLCVAPHKSLYAPMGIGVLICRKPIENTVIEGGTGTDSLDFSQPKMLPESMESGTINVPAILGVGAGVDFVKKQGIEAIYKHEFSLLQRLYDELSKNENIILYTKAPKLNHFVPVLPFNFKGLKSHELAEILNRNDIAVRAGFHCAPTAHKRLNTLSHGAVRVSFGAFNTMNEVAKLVAVLKDKKIIKIAK